MDFHSSAALMEALRLHRLLDAKQLEALQTLVFPDSKALAKELIQRGWLTPYQANQLLNGKGQELVLGSYILLERLGEGGMGLVFKARHRSLNRISAIKLIRKERLDNAGAIKRFQREMRSAAALSHPNIVLAYDADEIAGTHLMVMEYIEGAIDLAKLVKKNGPLPVERACEYIRQAALGLQHACERGMVHRDIKPANLLLTTDGKVVKVLDMGLARLDLTAETDDETSSAMTQEGAVMGTPDYIAPEQALDTHTVDIRADLYSLGCTLYFLLSGRVPFPGGTLLQKLYKHQYEEPLPIEKLRPEVPPELAAVVRKLMAKQPDDRYQSPAEAAEALADIGRALTGIAAPRMVGAPAKNPPAGKDAAANTLAVAFAYIEKHTDTVAYEAPAVAHPKRGRRWWLVLLGTVLGVSAGLAIILLLIPGGVQPPEPEPNRKDLGKKALPVKATQRYALYFNGETSYVTIPTLKYTGAHSLTVEAWTMLERPAESRKIECLVGNPEWSGFALHNHIGSALGREPAKGNFNFFLKERKNYVTVWSQAPLPRRQWVHLAGVYEQGKEVRYYVDGKWQAEAAALGTYGPSAADFCLGANPPLPGRAYAEHFQGRFKGVRLSTVARYGRDDFTPRQRFEPDRDTLALYRFDEGEGDILKDSSGNKHHGTIVAARWVKAEETPFPPLDPAWKEAVAGMKTEAQVAAIQAELKRRNPDFQDGDFKATSPGRDVYDPSADLWGFLLCTDRVADITPLQVLPLVSHLRLNLNGSSAGMGRLVDLTPLRGLSLKYLEIRNNPITDLTPLEGLPLYQLYATDIRVADLRPLAAIPHLNSLHFSTEVPADLTPLWQLPLLGLWLRLPQDKAEAKELIDPLRSMYTLKWINNQKALDFWKQHDPQRAAYLQWLAHAQQLTCDNQVAAVKAELMQQNPKFDGKLEVKLNKEGAVGELILQTDHVTDIAAVRAFPQLRELTCVAANRWHGGRLVSLEPLRGLPLTQLDLRGNRDLSDLRPLARMPLTWVQLSGTGISDLRPLGKMQLRHFYCAGCPLSDLSPLKGQPIKHLMMGRSAVQDLTPLATMEELRWVDFSDTAVADLTPLAALKLEDVRMKQTRVKDITPLAKCPLQYIGLDYQPARDAAVLRSIPTLKTINAQPAAEVLNAK